MPSPSWSAWRLSVSTSSLKAPSWYLASGTAIVTYRFPVPYRCRFGLCTVAPARQPPPKSYCAPSIAIRPKSLRLYAWFIWPSSVRYIPTSSSIERYTPKTAAPKLHGESPPGCQPMAGPNFSVWSVPLRV